MPIAADCPACWRAQEGILAVCPTRCVMKTAEYATMPKFPLDMVSCKCNRSAVRQKKN